MALLAQGSTVGYYRDALRHMDSRFPSPFSHAARYFGDFSLFRLRPWGYCLAGYRSSHIRTTQTQLLSRTVSRNKPVSPLLVLFSSWTIPDTPYSIIARYFRYAVICLQFSVAPDS